jgi:Fe-S-cluster-containing hydrogenase component 2
VYGTVCSHAARKGCGKTCIVEAIVPSENIWNDGVLVSELT